MVLFSGLLDHRGKLMWSPAWVCSAESHQNCLLLSGQGMIVISFCLWHQKWPDDAPFLVVAGTVVWLISLSSSFCQLIHHLSQVSHNWLWSTEGLSHYFCIHAEGPYSVQGGCSPGPGDQRGHLRGRQLVGRGHLMPELWRRPAWWEYSAVILSSVSLVSKIDPRWY